ncbi:uncharacterized protein LOC124374657 isoform X2 [Homalodisca vitripennis]|nr:uncharacterized protein LOC124374657 isoform X2 [Homalodisca vitripennis]XP_046688804.1 uncharacterized protein LOC124374657 isoform X2 [Homalodisca vitripennis]
MAKPVKGGYLLRHKKRLFGRAWREEWVVLYEDSTLAWFKEKGRGEPEGSVVVKDAPEMLAVSQWTLRIPGRPVLPSGCHVVQLMAFGTRGGDKVHWLLAQSEEEVNLWMTAISNTLPPPPQTTKPPDDKPATSPADPEHPRLPPVQIYNSVNGERPAIISTGDVGGALLLGAAINWGQGLGWSWAPSQCRAPHHCCCCDTAPHQHDVSHNQCCGCDTAPHQHDVTQNQCCCCDTVNCDTHTVAHHHDILYDTCNGFDDVDYSMDCSGDFGF